MHSTAPERERAYLVGVAARNGHGFTAQASLDELAQLVDTAGAVVVGATLQRLESPHPATYVGKGKLEEVQSARDATGYTLVVFDDELSPSQQRNLERALGVKVLDRTAVVLDIFAARARTREGRLQVELAQLEYLLPRLAGQWSHLERLGGGIGTRGPGETQLETDRRLVRERITRLRRQLDEVRRHRRLYRRRRERAGVPVVSLVGYTNAGKSTLMNRLTHAGVLAEDRVFATLDPVTRRLRLPDERDVLLTDTVGFIQKLPSQLVAAFRATLEELQEADVLVNVVDITHPDAQEQLDTVERTLRDLEIGDRPRLTVLNKVDRLVDESGRPIRSLDDLPEAARALAADQPHTYLVSAEQGWGLDDVLAGLAELLREQEYAGHRTWEPTARTRAAGYAWP